MTKPLVYKLEVEPEELGVLAAALNELPRKVSQPLFVKFQAQIEAQEREEEDQAALPEVKDLGT